MGDESLGIGTARRRRTSSDKIYRSNHFHFAGLPFIERDRWNGTVVPSGNIDFAWVGLYHRIVAARGRSLAWKIGLTKIPLAVFDVLMVKTVGWKPFSTRWRGSRPTSVPRTI
jgi:hypothetical protein